MLTVGIDLAQFWFFIFVSRQVTACVAVVLYSTNNTRERSPAVVVRQDFLIQWRRYFYSEMGLTWHSTLEILFNVVKM